MTQMSVINVFTDGSCVGNGRRDAVGGYGVYFENNILQPISKPMFPDARKGIVVTNNRAELTAILAAMYVVQLYNVRVMQIYVDSEYCKNMLEKYCFAGKQIPLSAKNADLLMLIRDLYESQFKPQDKRIAMYHVRSHTNKTDFATFGNIMADKLAEEGRNAAIRLAVENAKHVRHGRVLAFLSPR